MIDAADHAWEGARQILTGEERTWLVYDTAATDVALFGGLLLTVAALAALLQAPAVRLLGLRRRRAVDPAELPVGGPAADVAAALRRRAVAAAPVGRARRWSTGRSRGAVVVGASLVVLALVSARVATWRWVG